MVRLSAGLWSVYNRYNRWSRKRFWINLLDALAGALTKSTSIDSTYVKAQRAAFGGKGGEDTGYRPQPGRTNNQNPCVD
mgnify:CR=1 FL=1